MTFGPVFRHSADMLVLYIHISQNKHSTIVESSESWAITLRRENVMTLKRFLHSLFFVVGIYRSPAYSPHRSAIMRSFDIYVVFSLWISYWTRSRVACDCDVMTLMRRRCNDSMSSIQNWFGWLFISLIWTVGVRKVPFSWGPVTLFFEALCVKYILGPG